MRSAKGPRELRRGNALLEVPPRLTVTWGTRLAELLSTPDPASPYTTVRQTRTRLPGGT